MANHSQVTHAWAHQTGKHHFHVDAIEPNGDFRAGCHVIRWQECERLAREIGVFDETGSTEALELSAVLHP